MQSCSFLPITAVAISEAVFWGSFCDVVGLMIGSIWPQVWANRDARHIPDPRRQLALGA